MCNDHIFGPAYIYPTHPIGSVKANPTRALRFERELQLLVLISEGVLLQPSNHLFASHPYSPIQKPNLEIVCVWKISYFKAQE